MLLSTVPSRWRRGEPLTRLAVTMTSDMTGTLARGASDLRGDPGCGAGTGLALGRRATTAALMRTGSSPAMAESRFRSPSASLEDLNPSAQNPATAAGSNTTCWRDRLAAAIRAAPSALVLQPGAEANVGLAQMDSARTPKLTLARLACISTYAPHGHRSDRVTGRVYPESAAVPLQRRCSSSRHDVAQRQTTRPVLKRVSPVVATPSEVAVDLRSTSESILLGHKHLWLCHPDHGGLKGFLDESHQRDAGTGG